MQTINLYDELEEIKTDIQSNESNGFINAYAIRKGGLSKVLLIWGGYKPFLKTLLNEGLIRISYYYKLKHKYAKKGYKSVYK